MTLSQTKYRTLGISPKMVLAFLFPAISTIAGTFAYWIVSGDLNVTELRAAGAGLLLSAVAALGAYIGRPNPTVPQ